MWLNFNCNNRTILQCELQPVIGSCCAGDDLVTTFGKRLRELRKKRGQSQKKLAELVAINFTYLSKIENERLDFAQFPSEELICKLAKALDADENELLILANKIPEQIKRRVIERPDAFRKFAVLDDETIDRILKEYCEDE